MVSSVDHAVIVIGAGPAGLAVGACLRQKGIPSIILEQNGQVGSAWYRHYDRLHLHTDKRNSQLPFLPFPKEYPRYPSRSQVIDYLKSYAKKFGLEIRFGQRVVSACHQDDRWNVQTQDRSYQAPDLVIATGYNRQPFLPTWPNQEAFSGPVIHSSQYKNGESFRGQKALVVGFGNSGGEIVIDLFEHGAHPSLAVRSAVNVIPRELFGIPFLSICIPQSRLPWRFVDAINAPILRAVFGDLTKYGLRKLPYGPMTQVQRDGHIPLIDVGTIELIKKGQVTVYGGIKQFRRDGIRFLDGNEAPFDSVILATGYRPCVNAFLEGTSATFDANGTPLSSGRATSTPGLYFCGFYVSPTGMLREIGKEAKQISTAIASGARKAKTPLQ